MCHDYVYLDNLSDISAYRNHNVLMYPVPNQLQSRGVSPRIVTHLLALLHTCFVSSTSAPTSVHVAVLVISVAVEKGASFTYVSFVETYERTKCRCKWAHEHTSFGRRTKNCFINSCLFNQITHSDS